MAFRKVPVDLSPLRLRCRPVPRLAQLLVGLVAYGASMGLMVRAELGLSPWDVLHEGLSERLGWTFGAVTALTGVLVMLAWLPLRQRPGIGTVANVVVIAFAVDITLALVPRLDALPGRIALMAGAVVLNGLATAGYVGARLGPGPRDGLMTGVHARTGWSIRVVRTTIEVVVLAGGWVLGGTVGVGTALYAAAIGPLTQVFLRFTTVGQKKISAPRDILDTTQ
ncbi:YczE/YyaS/YitT family protein [Saccharopolyspora hordei]|uniref:Putative membrane protein YczE n=1 Tax=Saccharopolyspora hordei TaxID=1838 RepID=A0A853AD07_9PSEU|nr:hypothetical protein [Saccharopolyspora hordei]NYI82344.1 putative membrane protein YczE [Saccharopolyspora hordei]